MRGKHPDLGPAQCFHYASLAQLAEDARKVFLGRSDQLKEKTPAFSFLTLPGRHWTRHEALQPGCDDAADHGGGFLRLQPHDHRRGDGLLAVLPWDVSLQEPERQRDRPQERGGPYPLGSVEDLLHRG